MAPRLDLQELLTSLLDSPNVYFQPPPDGIMEYPCIVYRRDSISTKFANNSPYSHKKRYQVTVIDRDPDSDIPGKVADLPLCIFDRFYVADKLNHDVFKLFF
jgi:hypothetical protein